MGNNRLVPFIYESEMDDILHQNPTINPLLTMGVQERILVQMLSQQTLIKTIMSMDERKLQNKKERKNG